MENEIADSVETKVNTDGIEIKRYRYNSFLSESSNHTISKVNEIAYKKVKYVEFKISLDIDYFDVENIEDYLVLKISFNGREYSKYVFLKNKKFEYLTGEN